MSHPNDDKIAQSMLPIQKEMMLDDLRKNELPFFLEKIKIDATVIKAKFDALVSEGFSEQQAIEIVKTRPLYE